MAVYARPDAPEVGLRISPTPPPVLTAHLQSGNPEMSQTFLKLRVYRLRSQRLIYILTSWQIDSNLDCYFLSVIWMEHAWKWFFYYSLALRIITTDFDGYCSSRTFLKKKITTRKLSSFHHCMNSWFKCRTVPKRNAKYSVYDVMNCFIPLFMSSYCTK